MKALALAVVVLGAAPVVAADPTGAPSAAAPSKPKSRPKKRAHKAAPKPTPAAEPEPAPAPAASLELTSDPAPPPDAPVVAPSEEPHAVSAETSVRVTVEPRDHRKPFYVRAGVAFIDPLTSSNPVSLANVTGPASLAVSDGPIAGSGATVGSATIPALIIGYRTPWLDHRLAIETVLGLPFTVQFKATGTLATQSIAPTALGIPTGVMALGPEIGQATAAPPVITATYELTRGRVRPYVGAGAAMLITTGAKVTNPQLTAVAQPEMKVSPAPGMVAQAGLDAMLGYGIYARIDVKFIALMQANAEVDHIQVKTPDLPLFDSVEVGTAKVSVWVNPLIVQAGLGLDF